MTSSGRQSQNPVGATSDRAVAPRVDGTGLVDARGRSIRLLGVNVSGTQDACVQNKGFGWGPLDASEARSIAKWQANVARVPLNEDCWLGINGSPAAYSGLQYQKAMKRWVNDLNRAGLVVVLDLFSTAPGEYLSSGQWPMPDADHAVRFWREVGSAFSRDASVIFDLFNEPFVGGLNPTAQDWSCWLNGCNTSFRHCLRSSGQACSVVTYQAAGMQDLLNAVRSSGAKQPIMVGGLNWAGDPCGFRSAAGVIGGCQWQRYAPLDPENQLIVSFHTYNWTACSTRACWIVDLGPLAEKHPIVTGELGETDCSSSYIAAFMGWADTVNVSYLATSWEPPGPTDPQHCVAAPAGANQDSSSTGGSNQAGINLRLLADWTGMPSTISPEGAAFRSHLRVVSNLPG